MNIFDGNTAVIENTISGQITDAAIEVHKHLVGLVFSKVFTR
jgi:hypothetical protein